MSPYLNSLRYALEGLQCAWKTERNFKLFVALYILSFLLGWFLGITARDWQVLIFTGSIFLAVELVNTALENFADAFDTHSKSQNDHHTQAIKATKDIAAAASLVCAIAWGAILVIILVPRMEYFVGW